ncbi:MAG: 2OG-Fe(II) oxygenase [Bacteroidetes bacterium]|nr:2OG-Fe(II) oxygenase [Bacteroidota bacterium]
MRSIWWRTLGHVSAYPAGTSLATHSDNDVNYRPGTIPHDQAAVQHVLSCTAVLNDDFDGGNMFFEFYDLEVPVSAGEILFFPSNYVGTHCVKLVTKGTRFSYVSWYGHGSPDENKNIVPRYLKDFGYEKGKIWMDHLYDDCDAACGEEHIGRRVFQRAYDH